MNLGDFEKQQNLKATLQFVRENLESYLDYARIQAQVKRAFYEACLERGFDEKQALELAKEYRA